LAMSDESRSDRVDINKYYRNRNEGKDVR